MGVALAGCGDPCVALCSNMADYAEECGFTPTSSDLATCEESQADRSADERGICRDGGTPDQVRAEWSCEELALYFD